MLRFHSFNNQSAFFSFSVQIFVGIEIKIMESFLGLISVRIVSPSFTYENNTSCISGYILSHRFLPLFLPGVKFQVFVILEASQFFFLRSCRQQESEKEQWTIDEWVNWSYNISHRIFVEFCEPILDLHWPVKIKLKEPSSGKSFQFCYYWNTSVEINFKPVLVYKCSRKPHIVQTLLITFVVFL